MIGSSRIAAEKCFSTELLGSNGEPIAYGSKSLCYNKNPESGYMCEIELVDGECTETTCNCAHGTAVASVAAGRSNDECGGATVCGIAPLAQLISINVAAVLYEGTFPFAAIHGYRIEDLKKALEYVYLLAQGQPYKDVAGGAVHIAAVNISVGLFKDIDQRISLAFSRADCDGLDSTGALQQSIDNLFNSKIAVVASSGNDGANGLTWPACYKHVIAVAATTKNDSIYANSNIPQSTSDLEVALAAPAADIWVAWPGSTNTNDRVIGADKQMSGTSFAAPQVAGAFALLREIRDTEPIDWIHWYLRSKAKVKSTGNLSVRRIQLDDSISLAESTTYDVNPWLTESHMKSWCQAHFAEDCRMNPGSYKSEWCQDSNGDGVGEVVQPLPDCFCQCVATEPILGLEGPCDDHTSATCEQQKVLAYGTCATKASQNDKGCPDCFTPAGKRKAFFQGLCGDAAPVGEACFAATGIATELVVSCTEGAVETCGDFTSCALSPLSLALSACGGGCGDNSCSTLPPSAALARGLGGALAGLALLVPPIALLFWRWRLITQRKRRARNGHREKGNDKS